MGKPEDFSAVPKDQMRNMLPEGHPANEEAGLTLFQQAAYPILLWFFDNQRNRGTGRTYLMAKVLIELAMRGETVKVEDLSAPEGFRPRVSHFRDVVLRLAQHEYRKHIFTYRHNDNTLTYEGRRP
jgi:hypothetical protein